MFNETLRNINVLLEPVEQFGEGNYELGNIQEVKTTEDFRSQNIKIRGCQTESTWEDCVTKRYRKLLIDKCSCLPFNLQNYSSNIEQVYHTSRRQ